MSDELNNKMDQFKELLDNEKMADTIKMLMTMLGNSQSNSPNPNPPSEAKPSENTQKTLVQMKEMPPLNNSNPRMGMDDTMETIIRIKKIVDKVNSADDPRVNLLMALKPYLGNNRQAKLDTAIKVVNLTKLSSVLSELDKR